METGYIYLLAGIIGIIISGIVNREKTKKALFVSLKIVIMILPILLFIFVLMGLVQVFLPRDTITALLGNSHGILSIIMGVLLGSITLIQPGAVFPFAGYLLDNGANYGSIYAFVMSAILIGIATIPLEIKMFGKSFTLVRNSLTLVSIFLMGILFKVVM